MSEARAAVRAALAHGKDAEALATAATALLGDTWWLRDLLTPWLAGLADDPWYDPPLRVARDRRRTTAVLAEEAGATLTATVLHALPEEATVAVSGRLAVTRYHRAGGARLLTWNAGAAAADFRAADAPALVPLPPVALADGTVRRLDGRRHGHALAGATAPVVTLTIAPSAGGLTRAYDRDTGRLRRVAANDADAARTRMLLTLLRLSGRADAGACFDAASRAPGFHLRWAAMREWLALDVCAATPRLRAMAAQDAHAEVRAAAAATLPLAEAQACRG